MTRKHVNQGRTRTARAGARIRRGRRALAVPQDAEPPLPLGVVGLYEHEREEGSR
jgi:hypothetical protein